MKPAQILVSLFNRKKNNNKLAVQLEIFNKIEDILEDYALYQFITDTEDGDNLDLNSAKKYYSNLEKST